MSSFRIMFLPPWKIWLPTDICRPGEIANILIAGTLLQTLAGAELMHCSPVCVCVCVMFVCLSWWWCYSMFWRTLVPFSSLAGWHAPEADGADLEHEHCNALGWDRKSLFPSHFPWLPFLFLLSFFFFLSIPLTYTTYSFFLFFCLFVFYKTGAWGAREMLDAALLKETKSNILICKITATSV